MSTPLSSEQATDLLHRNLPTVRRSNFVPWRHRWTPTPPVASQLRLLRNGRP